MAQDQQHIKSEDPRAQRELDRGLQKNLRSKMTYDVYLELDKILTAQHPKSEPAHHDETLFIIQHQTSELWMKLLIHELGAAVRAIRADNLNPCQKILARVKQVQKQLFEQWSVLETLTPIEYAEFRTVLGEASGFQSLQYRTLEFMLGNKHRGMLKFFRHNNAQHAQLTAVLEAPSLYDEFLCYLARAGHAVPERHTDRDWSLPHEADPELVPVFKRIYENRADYWREYAMCEQLIDVEESFQLWRFRHLKTVQRIIGNQMGTGGSSGVNFLRKALDLKFFPELIDVRTSISA